jgi:hypothetical protein
MNSSTRGTRYYAEDFDGQAPRWHHFAVWVVVGIGAAAFFMFVAFMVGSHYGAARTEARWQMKFDAELSRAVTAAKANIVGASPKYRCDAAERADYLSACFSRARGATRP